MVQKGFSCQILKAHDEAAVTLAYIREKKARCRDGHEVGMVRFLYKFQEVPVEVVRCTKQCSNCCLQRLRGHWIAEGMKDNITLLSCVCSQLAIYQSPKRTSFVQSVLESYLNKTSALPLAIYLPSELEVQLYFYALMFLEGSRELWLSCTLYIYNGGTCAAYGVQLVIMAYNYAHRQIRQVGMELQCKHTCSTVFYSAV